MKKRIFLFFAVVAVVATGCGVGDLKKEGHLFMESLKAGDADKSYALLHPSMQEAVGGAEGWKKWSATRKPTTWTFNGFQVKAGGAGQLTGDAVFGTGEKLDVELNFAKDGGIYKVIGIHFNAAK